jgi:hypothetical protein
VTTTSTCHRCGTRDADAGHAIACEWQAFQRRRVVVHGEGYGIHPATSTALWTHLRQVGDDPKTAADRAITVMDLGWRPVVGSEFAHLWSADVRLPAEDGADQ